MPIHIGRKTAWFNRETKMIRAGSLFPESGASGFRAETVEMGFQLVEGLADLIERGLLGALFFQFENHGKRSGRGCEGFEG